MYVSPLLRKLKYHAEEIAHGTLSHPECLAVLLDVHRKARQQEELILKPWVWLYPDMIPCLQAGFSNRNDGTQKWPEVLLCRIEVTITRDPRQTLKV